MSTFISYSRADSEFVIRFVKDLKRMGFEIWLDQIDIPKGSRWDDEIEKALDASTAFIVILSPTSMDSQNVKDEVAYALDARKPILPLVLKPCNPPFRLRRFQFVDFTSRPYEDSLKDVEDWLRNAGEDTRKSFAKNLDDQNDLVESIAKFDSKINVRDTPEHGLVSKRSMISEIFLKTEQGFSWYRWVVFALFVIASCAVLVFEMSYYAVQSKFISAGLVGIFAGFLDWALFRDKNSYTFLKTSLTVGVLWCLWVLVFYNEMADGFAARVLYAIWSAGLLVFRPSIVWAQNRQNPIK